MLPHVVVTVQEAGWSGLRNGELLKRAEPQFNVFLTVDRNLRYQQNLLKNRIAILLVMAKFNNIRSLVPLVPEILKALGFIKPGELVIVGH
ncbi:MAG: hypothetical protein ACRD6I_14080 [Candidatus Acidiferrales bacterium]